MSNSFATTPEGTGSPLMEKEREEYKERHLRTKKMNEYKRLLDEFEVFSEKISSRIQEIVSWC